MFEVIEQEIDDPVGVELAASPSPHTVAIQRLALFDGLHEDCQSPHVVVRFRTLTSGRKTYAHRHEGGRFALLRRMLRCGECGSLIQPAWTTNHDREYRYYTCSKRIKTGYGKCKLPSLPAGEIETVVVDQLRALLRHPDVIARTYREIQDRAEMEPSLEKAERLGDLRQRRAQLQESIRTVLSVGDRNSVMADELKRLNGELNALDRSISQLESHPVNIEPVELARVTGALGRIDPIWDVLHPEEQRWVLELLVEKITVSQGDVEVRFRANGIEQVVEELQPMGAEG